MGAEHGGDEILNDGFIPELSDNDSFANLSEILADKDFGWIRIYDIRM